MEKQEVVKVISEWKKKPKNKVPAGMKMVEAIVKIGGELVTRHLAIAK